MSKNAIPDRFCFDCPLCDTNGGSSNAALVSQFGREHMTAVHGGPYTAADDLAAVVADGSDE